MKQLYQVFGLVALTAFLLFLVMSHLTATFDPANKCLIPVSCIEEECDNFVAARNFMTYGFFHSGWLQDFSTSADPADHPFVYSHMPPGPETLEALLLMVSGESYRFARIVVMITFLAGIAFYLRFIQVLLNGRKLAGCAWAFLLVSPFQITQHMERPVYSLFLLLGFAPLVFLDLYCRNRHRKWLHLSIAGVFLSSIYLEYILLSSVIFCWILLFFTQLMPISRKLLLVVLGVFASGVLLHLFQNFLYFGPSLFFEEMKMLMLNRITGYPAKAELAAYYQSHGMVHHGSHQPDPGRLWMQLSWNFLPNGFGFPLLYLLPLLAAALALSFFCRRADKKGAASAPALLRGDATYLGKLLLVAAGSIALPIALFPSFTQEYNLVASGANQFYLAIPCAAGLAYAFAAFAEWWKKQLWGPAPILVGAFTLVLFGYAGTVMGANVFRHVEFLNDLYHSHRYVQIADLEKFCGSTFMTNINTSPVGFFVRAAGFAVCGPDTISADGSVHPEKAKIAFMKNYRHYETERPAYFFFFFWDPGLFPGFADCFPPGAAAGLARGDQDCFMKMFTSLHETYPIAYRNDLFIAFDLRHPRAAAPATSTP